MNLRRGRDGGRYQQEGKQADRAGEGTKPSVVYIFLCLEEALACLYRREEDYLLPLDESS